MVSSDQQRLEEVLQTAKVLQSGKTLDTYVMACHLSANNDVALILNVKDIPPPDRAAFDQWVRRTLTQGLQDMTFQISYTTQSSESASEARAESLKPAFDPSQVRNKITKACETPKSAEPTKPSATPGVPQPEAIPGIKHIIAVASGKGGVGKSTVSALLACAFTELGLKTALVDADVYGPSQVQLFGCRQMPEVKPAVPGGKAQLIPVRLDGISLMSFSFFMDLDDPVIWRGPMIMSVLRQFFFDVAWGPQDVMIVDLPPGTGDAPLSMIQSVPVDGAVIVTTPQVISVLDAIKGGQMFNKLKVPVLGVVENMSGFICDHCDTVHDIFRKGGGDIAADKIQTTVLARLPLHPQICDWMDQGKTWKAFRHRAVHDPITALARTLAKSVKITSYVG